MPSRTRRLAAGEPRNGTAAAVPSQRRLDFSSSGSSGSSRTQSASASGSSEQLDADGARHNMLTARRRYADAQRGGAAKGSVARRLERSASTSPAAWLRSPQRKPRPDVPSASRSPRRPARSPAAGYGGGDTALSRRRQRAASPKATDHLRPARRAPISPSPRGAANGGGASLASRLGRGAPSTAAEAAEAQELLEKLSRVKRLSERVAPPASRLAVSPEATRPPAGNRIATSRSVELQAQVAAVSLQLASQGNVPLASFTHHAVASPREGAALGVPAQQQSAEGAAAAPAPGPQGQWVGGVPSAGGVWLPLADGDGLGAARFASVLAKIAKRQELLREQQLAAGSAQPPQPEPQPQRQVVRIPVDEANGGVIAQRAAAIVGGFTGAAARLSPQPRSHSPQVSLSPRQAGSAASTDLHAEAPDEPAAESDDEDYDTEEEPLPTAEEIATLRALVAAEPEHPASPLSLRAPSTPSPPAREPLPRMSSAELAESGARQARQIAASFAAVVEQAVAQEAEQAAERAGPSEAAGGSGANTLLLRPAAAADQLAQQRLQAEDAARQEPEPEPEQRKADQEQDETEDEDGHEEKVKGKGAKGVAEVGDQNRKRRRRGGGGLACCSGRAKQREKPKRRERKRPADDGRDEPESTRPAPAHQAGARDEAVSVTFTETGSLGLRLIWEPSSSRLTLKGVHEGTQAERHSQLRRHLAQGLLLRSVGGEDVVGKSYEESIASLKASSRPLTVTFDLVGPEDDEGAG